MMRYAGIGPRVTPPDQLQTMTSLANTLTHNSYWLVSGHGDGADQAWEIGASEHHQTVWLPWAGFNGANQHPAFKVISNPNLFNVAKDFHPNWHNLSDGAKRLMARNVAILFGNDFNEQVEFVLYWQAEGVDKYKGGTGHTLRMADGLKIPNFNIGSEADRKRLETYVNQEPT